METVELGDVRLHVVTTWPGLSGEADRVAREVSRLDPALVLADLDTESALRLQVASGDAKVRFEPAFLDALFEQEVARRFTEAGPHGEHPFLGAARVARNRKATFLPLRPKGDAPGFFARRRARKAALAIPDCKVEAFAPAFSAAMASAGAWDPAKEVASCQPRVRRALEEGRGPLVVLVQAHRAPALVEQLRATRRNQS
jgi:hypothetical protein